MLFYMRFYPALFTDDVDIPPSEIAVFEDIGETVLPKNNCERFKEKEEVLSQDYQ
jgi:hypothetical protein